MKKEKYIVEIEMPDGDTASSMYIHDVIQSDCDIEDEGRWKVSVKEWKPSEEQIKCLKCAIGHCRCKNPLVADVLECFMNEIKQL